MFLFLIFSLFCGILLYCTPKNRVPAQYAGLILGVIMLYWGFSYINAPDIDGYMDYYAEISTEGWVLDSFYGLAAASMEPGLFIIMQLCKRIVDSYFFFQFVLLSIELLLVFGGLKKLFGGTSQTIVFFLLFLFQIPFFLAAMRQGVAIAIMIFCLPLFQENKFYFYIPLLILAIFFHQSAILLFIIPIFLLLFKKVNPSSQVLNIMYMLVFLGCNFCYAMGISAGNLIENAFGDFVYDSALSTSRSLTVEDSMEASDFGFLKLLEIDICYILFFFSRVVRKDASIRLMGSLFLIYFLINTLVGGIIIHRINYYLTIPYYIVLFRSLYCLLEKVLRDVIYKSDAFKYFVSNTDEKVIQRIIFGVSNLTIYAYMFATYMLQSVSSSNYIFEYHLFDIL